MGAVEDSTGLFKSPPQAPRSRQLRILSLGLLQDWDVGIGILPQRKKILIGRLCPGPVSRQSVCAGQAEMRQRSNGRVHHNPPMVEDLLKLSRGFVAPMRGEICFPTHVNGIERARRTQFVRRRSLKYLD